MENELANKLEIEIIASKFQNSNREKAELIIYAFTLHSIHTRLNQGSTVLSDDFSSFWGNYNVEVEDHKLPDRMTLELNLVSSSLNSPSHFSLTVKVENSFQEEIEGELRLCQETNCSFMATSKNSDFIFEFFFQKTEKLIFVHLYKAHKTESCQDYKFIIQKLLKPKTLNCGNCAAKSKS